MKPQAAGELDVFSCPLGGIALIEASAGTGKTWNICGLYLRHLLEKDLPVSRLLVVTFTRAATAELSARIRARVLAALRAVERAAPDADDAFTLGLLAAARVAGVDDATIHRRLRAALLAFDEAAIFTIHGFCQRALADASFSAGLPQNFDLGEDDDDLCLEETRDFWRRELVDIDVALAEHLLACGDSPERWAQWLKASQARPLARTLWDEDGDGGGGEAGRNALDALSSAYDAAYHEARRLWDGGNAPRQALVDAQRGLNGNSYRPGFIETAFQQWTSWLATGEARADPGKDLKLHLFGSTMIVRCTNKGHVPPAHAFFDAAQILLDTRERFNGAMEAARRQVLRRFITCAGLGLRARKQAERRMAFDDILWNAHEALTSGRRPWLAEALHTRYPVALIDEFQDTDPLQLAIFRSIYANDARRGGLFLVGDPKQAIYSFRGADLYTYLGARDLADARYSLSVNRRSSPALVAACNRLFAANPKVFMETGLDFQPAQAQAASKTLDERTSSGHAALRLWRIPREAADGGYLPRAEVIARAAAASAAEIVRLLAAGERGEIRIGENALQPVDLAVLVRSHREGRIMREALAARGVGSVELSQRSVFESFEAEELERVLMAVAEPSRERLLKTALATVLMGGDAATLARLADDEDALIEQFERFGGWREDWRRRGFAFMLWRWMANAGVAERLLALEDGERRLTNLLHLAELLQREAGRASPAGLLRMFARRRAEGGGGDDALLRLESDRNLVRIVTIHHAKGLQYGIVFCPFLFDGFPLKASATGPMRFWHDEDGGQVVDWRREAADKDAIHDRLVRERDAESLRCVYVALTRAEHRCYLTVGCYGKGSSTAESARSLLNWMIAGADVGPEAWRKSNIAPDEIDARWRALAEGSEGAIALDDLPSGQGASLPWNGEQAHFSAPRAPHVPEGWRLGSFSALISNATHEDAARDHDARAEWTVAAPPEPASATAPVPEDDILRFPRGAAAGDCVHAVFESIDFTRPETRAASIAGALAAHPPASGIAASPAAALLPRMLARMLDDVLSTALSGNEGEALRLSAVPMARRLSEFGFYLPSPRLDIAALNGWLSAHGYGMPRLRARDLSGYLKGYIDLVFEHAGRYWVLDWKSNYLGETPQSYASAALEAAMTQHGYHLQHLLYTVALHRHLGRTLSGYDYERHFGGVLYLFVRGVRPGWREANGAPCGVFRHRAAKASIESLDALLTAHVGSGKGGRR